MDEKLNKPKLVEKRKYNKIFRLIGTVVQNKETVGYVVFNEVNKKVLPIGLQQIIELLKSDSIVNAEYVNGKVNCTENSVNSLPKFDTFGKIIDGRIFGYIILSELTDVKGKSIGYKVLTSKMEVVTATEKQLLDKFEQIKKYVPESEVSGIIPNAKVTTNEKTDKLFISAIKGSFPITEISTESVAEVAPGEKVLNQWVKDRHLIKVLKKCDYHFLRALTGDRLPVQYGPVCGVGTVKAKSNGNVMKEVKLEKYSLVGLDSTHCYNFIEQNITKDKIIKAVKEIVELDKASGRKRAFAEKIEKCSYPSAGYREYKDKLYRARVQLAEFGKEMMLTIPGMKDGTAPELDALTMEYFRKQKIYYSRYDTVISSEGVNYSVKNSMAVTAEEINRVTTELLAGQLNLQAAVVSEIMSLCGNGSNRNTVAKAAVIIGGLIRCIVDQEMKVLSHEKVNLMVFIGNDANKSAKLLFDGIKSLNDTEANVQYITDMVADRLNRFNIKAMYTKLSGAAKPKSFCYTGYNSTEFDSIKAGAELGISMNDELLMSKGIAVYTRSHDGFTEYYRGGVGSAKKEDVAGKKYVTSNGNKLSLLSVRTLACDVARHNCNEHNDWLYSSELLDKLIDKLVGGASYIGDAVSAIPIVNAITKSNVNERELIQMQIALVYMSTYNPALAAEVNEIIKEIFADSRTRVATEFKFMNYDDVIDTKLSLNEEHEVYYKSGYQLGKRKVDFTAARYLELNKSEYVNYRVHTCQGPISIDGCEILGMLMSDVASSADVIKEAHRDMINWRLRS